MLKGNFDYIPVGLQCITHIRWFTEHSIRQALKDTGFFIDVFQKEKVPPTKEGEKFIKTMCRSGYELMAVKKDAVYVTSYCKDDEHNILPAFNEAFNSHRTLEHWRWKYDSNPFGRHKIAQAMTNDGKIASHYAAYPVPYYSSAQNPQKSLAYQCGDTWVDCEFRGSLKKGKQSVLYRTVHYFYRKFCIDQIMFCYGFNTGKIREIGEKFLEYEYLPQVTCHVKDLAVHPLNGAHPIKRLWHGLSVERVTSTDRTFDIFFDRVCNDYRSLVMRHASYLKWRYLDCPDKVYHLYAVKRRGYMVGWGCFTSDKDVLFWGDALFDKKYAFTAEYLLHDVWYNDFRDTSQIYGWFSTVPIWWHNALGKMGFERRKEPNQLAPVYKGFNSQFATDFFKRNHYYTKGDSDLF